MVENSVSQVFVTGDCHGDYHRFNSRNFFEQKTMTKMDYVLVCGDFGFWFDDEEQNHKMDWLDGKNFTTLWIDGNHENYDLLKKYPVEEWNGGKVQFIRPSIIHLMRGQVYEIGGKKLFTFGGASSHDCEVILEPDDPRLKQKQKRLNTRNMLYRVNHKTWWQEELPSQEEMEEGLRNLEWHNWKVDYIFSHCCPDSILEKFFMSDYKKDILTGYLEQIREKCEYKKWFFGHYHENRNIGDGEIAIYEQIIRII